MMMWNRRRLLTACGALAGVSAAALLSVEARGEESGARRIALRNLHTGERLDVEYCRGGQYLSGALAAIDALLRDFRTGERHAIDARLLDYLSDVACAAGADPAFEVISGYRSRKTNAQLRAASTGVAAHSLHMEGRAIDVRITGLDCASLAARARELVRGGVGYYRASDFVHLDTGAFRTWKG